MSKKYLIAILLGFVGLLILQILFVNFKDRLDPSQQVIDLVIENKKMVSLKDPIEIKKGKKVTFLIKGDEDEQLHLEGYHAFTSFKANELTELKFDALTAGKFSLWLDKSHTFLASVVISE
jgi:hypothetical protein